MSPCTSLSESTLIYYQPPTTSAKVQQLSRCLYHSRAALVVPQTVLMSPRTYAPSSSTYTEDPDRYRENGLHPLIIGDTLKMGDTELFIN